MFEFYDCFFSTIYWISGIFGITFNVLLLVLIFTRSPPSLKEYKILLINVAITDLVYATSIFLLQPRLIPNKWAFAYIALGPIRHFGSRAAYLTYCVQLHAIFYTFLCFPLSFGFRFYVLIKPVPHVRSLLLIIFGLWFVAFAQHVLFIFSESDPNYIRSYLHQNKPLYNLTGYVISGNHMIHEPLTSITLFTIVVPMFPIYLIVIYFRRRVHQFLAMGTQENKLSPTTIRGHQRLIQALTIQALLPVFFIFPPISIYGVYHLELIDLTIIEYLVYVLFSFFPVFSPLITLHFVRPYNVAVRKFFGLAQNVSNSRALATSVGVAPISVSHVSTAHSGGMRDDLDDMEESTAGTASLPAARPPNRLPALERSRI